MRIPLPRSANNHHLQQLKPIGVICFAIILVNGCFQSESTQNDQLKTTGASSGQIELPPTSDIRTLEAKYVADTQCAPCHQEIYDSYQKVAMAKSFYDFDDQNTVESFDENENHFFHPPSGNHYEMNVVGGQLEMKRFKLRDDGTRYAEFQTQAGYVVGSGNHVRTYLTRNEMGELYQLPVVWYSQEKKWAMAPGYDRPDHLDFGRQITRQCMFCHNAYPEFAAGSDHFGQPHLFPKQLPQGIGCQRCHGPGSEHVRISNEVDETSADGIDLIRDSIINSARLSPELQDDVCNQCHFQPMSQRSSFVRKFGKGDYDYQPGQPLSEFLLHLEPDRDNDLADHFEINHHPYRLFQSECYIQTPGGIRCTDCHDPHSVVKKPQRAAYYRQKCFACHEKDDCGDVERGRAADANCVQCHMPERRTTDVVHVTMTDHKIERRPSLPNPTARLKEIDVPIDMPIRKYKFAHRKETQDRTPEDKLKIYRLFARALDDDDTAMEPLNEVAFSEANSSPLPIEPLMQLAQMQLQYKQYNQAKQTLQRINSPANQLSLFHTHLGVSQIGTAQLSDAIASLKQAIATDPNNATAWYNLGIAQQRAEQTEAALESFATAVKLRPTYAKAIKKRGTLLAREGQYEQAAERLHTAIAIAPNDASASIQLATIMRIQDQFGPALQTLQDTWRTNPDNLETLQALTWTLLDSDNTDNRDSALALENAEQLYRMSPNANSILARVIALIQNDQANVALKFLGDRLQQLDQENRKPEAGLLLAICQLKLNSAAAGRQNYEAARSAIGIAPSDRLSSIVVRYAEQVFDNKR